MKILLRSGLFNIFFFMWTGFAVIVMGIFLIFPRDIMASVVLFTFVVNLKNSNFYKILNKLYFDQIFLFILYQLNI